MKAIVSAHGNGIEPNVIHISLCRDFKLRSHNEGTELQLIGPCPSVVCTIGTRGKPFSTNIMPAGIGSYYFTRWIKIIEI